MIGVFFLTLAAALLSFTLFTRFQLTTENFEGKKIPYCLGVPIVSGFLASCFFLPLPPNITVFAVLYVFFIWVTGLLDDRFGSKQPKGFKGHFRLFFQEGKITTGLLKIGVTGVASLGVVMTEQEHSLFEAAIILFVLLLTPHVMNLFDTRPLRTLKVSCLYLLTLVPFLSLSSMKVAFFIACLFILLAYFESKTMAMLGDNGATTIGAILALMTIYYSPMIHQLITLFVWAILTFLAEKLSFSQMIERFGWLKRLDLLGNPAKK